MEDEGARYTTRGQSAAQPQRRISLRGAERGREEDIVSKKNNFLEKTKLFFSRWNRL
jgi:hypothetical protein